jgi:hypothetical protein
MAPTAAYDEIADWYEQEFPGGQPATGKRAGERADADPLGIGRALRRLLGRGSGTCLDIGCGTGVQAATVRELGWTPVGVHPCFCGGFADRSERDAVVIGPGYLDGHWTTASWSDQGVRAKVGATHRPLPELLHGFLDAGLTLERFAEGGAPTPAVLAVSARKRG